MPRTGEREGKFTIDQRDQLKAQAWTMHLARVPQQDIANRLDVSQATICRWLGQMRLTQPKAQHVIAEKIRAELVCCDIYQRLEDLNEPGQEQAWKKLRHSHDYHDICHYGEWAARIAEQF